MSDDLWRREFSPLSSESAYIERRQFAKFLTLASLGMFAGNLWILARSWFAGEAAYPMVAVAREDELPVGGVKLFGYPRPEDGCILVRVAQDRYVAYSRKCTHLACAVYYSRPRNRLECPCHEGYFSILDGSVLEGPPPRPLERVQIERRDGQLIAVGMVSREGA